VKRRGFTLMELSIVTCLIVIAFVAMALVFAGGRHAAKRTICLSNLSNLGVAFQMYAADNDGLYPRGADWPGALEPYVRNREVYRCPMSGRPREFPPKLETDYIYLPGLSNEAAPDQAVLGDDAARHEGGGNVVTVDGSAQWWPAERWRTFAAQVEGEEEP